MRREGVGRLAGLQPGATFRHARPPIVTRAAFFLAVALSAGAFAAGEVKPIAARLAAADPAAGQTAFGQCQACHVTRPGAQATVGPNLWGVVGRDIASQEGYEYSRSLQVVKGKWDYAMLDRYLRDPKALAPQGKMVFPGIADPAQRADLIAYLRTLHGDPPPLPRKPAGATAKADAAAPQDWEGLPPGPGREDVFFLCRACHSLMLVKQQGLSRARWDDTLTWMVEEQGMAPIEDAQRRKRVLDYLATHYGPN